MATLIQVTNEVWKKLNELKSKPNESFNDVLARILKINTKKVKNEKNN